MDLDLELPDPSSLDLSDNGSATLNLKIFAIQCSNNTDDTISPLGSLTDSVNSTSTQGKSQDGRFFPPVPSVHKHTNTSSIESCGSFNGKPGLVSFGSSSGSSSTRSFNDAADFTIQELPIPTRVIPSRRRLGTGSSFSSKDSVELLAIISAIDDDDDSGEDIEKTKNEDNISNTGNIDMTNTIDASKISKQGNKIRRTKARDIERPIDYLKNKLNKLSEQWDSVKNSKTKIAALDMDYLCTQLTGTHSKKESKLKTIHRPKTPFAPSTGSDNPIIENDA
uniref:Uncharacterized protein n=1 Tax=Corethron hystrix TaxID=216773 RepID=A0A7S1BH06_9STRA|mmetsp:Transcript_26615/g.61253  ORF Transcript_26615/g.61253 Transcript_26615/m.61253 type:complete len:280 (+) Transcript_26615:479-1318(+)|eukprot:CAMPEP_0113316218 /NCGR_PEP_ID=MMETSP0010_2-20120614/11569_1 /TAXON_ID=216773 ORGANISM="Corethron hystrix, Strain 308" /NCGR_SAMPLE_ID=MMETSP0010_2 /ASSEMBLY_ACC=CAM_ASM_000155 /LENGTH=279 /DNA_ID=CAMNT_0000172865 /DNA_START=382 /DNA_END=1221 /DNA_ORIENTATION=- /assembly_acc=CAM_ASM_000155